MNHSTSFTDNLSGISGYKGGGGIGGGGSGIGNNSGPTLTDHFKQALNMNRSQLQNSPSVVSSAAQLGLIGSGNGSTNLGGGVHFGSGSGNGAGTGTGTGITLNPTGYDYVLPPNPQLLQSSLSSPSSPSSPSSGFFDIYGKWIFLFIVASVVGVAVWIWYKKNYVNSNRTEESNTYEKMFSRRSSPLANLPSLQNYLQSNQSSSLPLPLSPGLYSSPQSQASQQLLPSSLPSFQNTLKSEQKSIREREQNPDMRGAELSNPNFMSSLRPQLPESRRDNTLAQPPSHHSSTQSLQYNQPLQQFQQPQQFQPPPQQQLLQQQPPQQQQLPQQFQTQQQQPQPQQPPQQFQPPPQPQNSQQIPFPSPVPPAPLPQISVDSSPNNLSSDPNATPI